MGKFLKENGKMIIIGICAGMINGFFSTGGGLILVPAFIYVLRMNEKEARGTSVFCILPLVLTSSLFYYKGNYINWRISILCAIGGAIGGYIGAKLLKKAPDRILKISFAIFILYIAFKMIYY